MKRGPIPLSVLIVEDHPPDAELAIHSLEREGYAVRYDVVARPDELRARVADGRYDVVLSDYRLRGWTGLDALAILRTAGSDLPLILVTGSLGEERAVECVKAGAADYVVKQHMSRLGIAVRHVLDEQRARREAQQAQRRRIAAEEELRKRDERFRQLAESIDEVFYLTDIKFRELYYINPAYERVWGRTTASLYENPADFINGIHPDDRALLFDNVTRMQAGEEPPGIEFRVVRPDGSVRWVLSETTPIRDASGGVYRMSGVVLDVTDRHEARAAIEERATRFRKLTEASFNAIAMTREGTLVEVNSGFVEMFGYESEHELIGRPLADLLDEESRAVHLQRVAAGQEGRYEVGGRKTDGTKILIEIAARTHEIDGKPGRIAALRDITAEHALEEQLRQSQKMEAVGRLAGGVAHDFNNLLTVVASYADFLEEDLGVGDARLEHVAEIKRAAAAASDLTRQLLAFSRQQIIEPKLVRLGDEIRATENMLRRVIGEDIELATALNDPSTAVLIDPGQFRQILMNLAVNARDAMRTGGKLTIELAEVELGQDYADAHWPTVPGRYAMVAVTDTGTGMDEATLRRVFEPFFTTKRPGEGTGLGLSTVYGIVKQSGGFVWVYSEPGKGATFKIYLPFAESAGISAPAEELTAAPHGTETVLIAEDAIPVRLAARRMLQRLGYTVLDAGNGRAALQVASTHEGPIDLLLTDVVMPEMSGRELSERIRTSRPTTKVLFMSGYTDDAVLRHGVLSATAAYIQKPFSSLGLARKVREVLDVR